MRISYKLLVIVISVFLLLSAKRLIYPVFAASPGDAPPGCRAMQTCKDTLSFACTMPKGVFCCPNAKHCDCVNTGGVYTGLGCLPVGSTDLNSLAGWFVSKAIYVASGAAFLFLIYGGFLLLTSAGDANKVKAGTELVSAALSGLLFIIVSVLLLKIIGVDILQIPGFFK